ncbi:histidine kinase dimerization/phospho-acceptor domain-containing protein [Paenibacillus sp. JTLBN-2024]
MLAENINVMSERLQHSLMEERAAVQAKNDLITGVSHDLRTPLTSILGFLEVIEQDQAAGRTRDALLRRYCVPEMYGCAAQADRRFVRDIRA